MSYPKRADHFKQWSDLMLKQAIVPERLEYKGAHTANKGMKTRRGRRKRFRSRKRHKQE